ncbi:MAG: hypothetical protein COA93_08120 [Alphaproteobacteria bacterium]|nr:MAG: hypothetical protein COA93_08120 [Alphaproteobacteria bacterium]
MNKLQGRVFNGLLNTPGFDQVDFSSLKLCIGGAAVQQAVADKWQQVTGIRLQEGYGLSETSPLLTLNFGRFIEGKDNNEYIAGIGVPDEKTGEAVKLFIVKEDECITEQDIIKFCRQSLAAYKVPKRIVFIDEIPKSVLVNYCRES